MESSLQHNSQRVQRRKMFPLNHRHNLRSNAELYWLGAGHMGYSPAKVMFEKKSSQEQYIRQNSNRYNERKASDYPKPTQKILPKVNPQQNIIHSYSPGQNFKTIESPLTSKEDALTKQISNFQKNNSSNLVSSRHRSIEQIPYKIYYAPQEQKLQNLRSSLDKPVYRNEGIRRSDSSEVIFKKMDEDKLEKFLRIGLKKSNKI